MAGGLFNRIKTWIFQEDLASSDLNNELNNIITHLSPEYIAGYEATVAQMQQIENPGTVGGENLGTSIADDIKQLRYQIQQIVGGPEWYSAPDSSINTLSSANLGIAGDSNNYVASGLVNAVDMPLYLVPSGSTTSVTLKASGTPFSCVINGVSHTFNSDITLTGLTVATNTGATATVGNDVTGNAITTKATVGEYLASLIDGNALTYQEHLPLATPGAAIVAKLNKVVAFTIGAEVSLGTVMNNFTEGTDYGLFACLRGFFFNSSSAWTNRNGSSTGDTVTLMNLTYLFLRSNGTLNACYNTPSYSATAPAGASAGDYWYDSANRTWKIFGTGWTVDNSIFVGYCAQNHTACTAARSADFFRPFLSNTSLELSLNPETLGQAYLTNPGGRCSVYGNMLTLTPANTFWDVAGPVEGSIVNGASIYFYLTPQGDTFLSTVCPHNRPDLCGYYHPATPARCVGSTLATGTTTLAGVTSFNSYPLQIPRVIIPGGFALLAPASASSTFWFYCRNKPVFISLYSGSAAGVGLGVNLSGTGDYEIVLNINDDPAGTNVNILWSFLTGTSVTATALGVPVPSILYPVTGRGMGRYRSFNVKYSSTNVANITSALKIVELG